jgi:hypothetical protein
MPKRRKDLRRRMAAIRASRPALQRQAERVLLAHYREHRQLPRGPLCAIVDSRRLYKIIARGEVEHVLGVAAAMRHLDRLRNRIAAFWKQPDA